MCWPLTPDLKIWWSNSAALSVYPLALLRLDDIIWGYLVKYVLPCGEEACKKISCNFFFFASCCH